MSHRLSLLAAVASLSLLAGCAGTDVNGALGAAGALGKAATLSDHDVRELSQQACAESDKKNNIAPAAGQHARRLAKIMASVKTTDVQKVDARVYLKKEVNAWAMVNGCVRVYSGLMDMMNDDELRGVVGHELGHVALGHTRSRLQVAYSAMAARGALAASGNGAVAALSSSQLGDLAENLINAQFSQKQENAADDYAFDLLTKNKAPTRGLVTAFEKLAKLDGGKGGMFASHPGSDERARRMEARMKQGG